MSNLVERLLASGREVASFPHPSHCDHLHDAAKVIDEAAAEIRRLREEKAALGDFDQRQIQTLNDEVARLRRIEESARAVTALWAEDPMQAHLDIVIDELDATLKSDFQS